jgi:hypothetical protein
METSIMFQQLAIVIARIGLVLAGMSLAYCWRMWALKESLGN